MSVGFFRAAGRVLAREVRRIGADRTLLMIALIAPVFYGFFYGSIYLHKGERDVPIAVVDADRSALSRTLVRSLDASGSLAVYATVPTFEEARALLLHDRIQAIVYVPAGFARGISQRQGADLRAHINAARFLVANDVNKALTEVVGTLAGGVRLRFFQARGFTADQALDLAEPLRAQTHALFNPAETYGDFFLPGLLALVLQQTLLMAVAVSAAAEREDATGAELAATAGDAVGPPVLAGKGLFYLIVFGIYGLFFFTVTLPALGLSVRGSAGALAALTALELVAVIAIALFIGSFLSGRLVALQFLVLSSYPAFLASGFSFPLAAMPRPVQWAAALMPSTPYLRGVVRVVQMGAGWPHVRPELLHLGLIATVAVLAAGLRLGVLARSSEPVA